MLRACKYFAMIVEEIYLIFSKIIANFAMDITGTD